MCAKLHACFHLASFQILRILHLHCILKGNGNAALVNDASTSKDTILFPFFYFNSYCYFLLYLSVLYFVFLLLLLFAV